MIKNKSNKVQITQNLNKIYIYIYLQTKTIVVKKIAKLLYGNMSKKGRLQDSYDPQVTGTNQL